MPKKLQKPTQEENQRQVDGNYKAFKKIVFAQSLKGKWVLLRNKKVVAILDSREEAYQIGIDMFEHAGLFSHQEIHADPVVIPTMWKAS